jgi:hypothetical protein
MNTPAPTIMTKEEAIVRLCDAARTSADPDFLRAVCIAAKCLARAGIHKRRNHAARSARGLPPFITPAPAPLSPDAPPMTETSAPAPDAAEPQTQE